MRKPIKSPLYFEARFRIHGKVIQSCMCPHCEEEGEIYVRIARDPSRPTGYDPKIPSTYVDIIGFDPKAAYLKVKPGDWVAADVICFGYMRKVRASRIEIEGNVFASGSRKIGLATVEEGRLMVDFEVFRANLVAQSEAEMEKILKRQRVRNGNFMETDCSVDIEVKAIRQQAPSSLDRTQRRRK